MNLSLESLEFRSITMIPWYLKQRLTNLSFFQSIQQITKQILKQLRIVTDFFMLLWSGSNSPELPDSKSEKHTIVWIVYPKLLKIWSLWCFLKILQKPSRLELRIDTILGNPSILQSNDWKAWASKLSSAKQSNPNPYQPSTWITLPIQQTTWTTICVDLKHLSEQVSVILWSTFLQWGDFFLFWNIGEKSLNVFWSGLLT